MNKKELIDFIAKETKTTQGLASEMLDAFTSAVTETLSKGEEVLLVGFGSFYTTVRAATKGRNPQTGKDMDLAESTQARFRPGKRLKDQVNGKKVDTKAAPKAASKAAPKAATAKKK